MSENRTAELWLKIDQLHLKFLQAEETPAKLEIRKKLEGMHELMNQHVLYQGMLALRSGS